ncbi:unnamed protein product, partial [Ectocarpus sp. 12 AP-2014]
PFYLLDIQNKCGRVINSVLSACNADGLAVVSGRLSLRQLLPPNVSPFGDITTAGGWAGLTGMQKWILSSIFGLSFAPIFADVNSMEKYVRSAEIEAVATRIGSDCDTPRGKEKVCRAFRDLMETCSASTFMVRLGSYTDDELRVLQKWQREQVKQASRVVGLELGSFHKGLHIPNDIRNLG